MRQWLLVVVLGIYLAISVYETRQLKVIAKLDTHYKYSICPVGADICFNTNEVFETTDNKGRLCAKLNDSGRPTICWPYSKIINY